MEEFYAQALYNLAHKPGADASALVRQMNATLVAEGRAKLLPGILRAFTRIDQKSQTLASHVEVASESESKNALAQAAALGIHASHATVNADLISGWRASGNGKVIDQSGKSALIDLYRSITAA